MSSTYFNILEAVKQRVLSVSNEITPVIRKRPILLATDAIPAIIISPGPGAETVGLEAFGLVVEYLYPVTITIVNASDRVTEVEVYGSLELRERIRQAMNQPKLGEVASVINTTIDLDPAYNTAAGPGTVYDVTAIRLTFSSIENRSA
jgi:hypothetical protein